MLQMQMEAVFMKKRMLYGVACAALLIFIIATGFIWFSSDEKQEVSQDLIDQFKNCEEGAVDTWLLYADEKIVIFYDRPALMVYDIKEKKIIRTLGLEELGVKYFQGDEAYCIYASTHGDKVMFEQAYQSNRFIYDVKKNTISKDSDEINELFKVENHFNNYMQYEEIDTSKYFALGAIGVKVNNEKYVFLTHNSSTSKLEGLEIVIVSSGKGKTEVIPVFVQ